MPDQLPAKKEKIRKHFFWKRKAHGTVWIPVIGKKVFELTEDVKAYEHKKGWLIYETLRGYTMPCPWDITLYFGFPREAVENLPVFRRLTDEEVIKTRNAVLASIKNSSGVESEVVPDPKKKLAYKKPK